jgi:hypothetical protein
MVVVAITITTTVTVVAATTTQFRQAFLAHHFAPCPCQGESVALARVAGDLKAVGFGFAPDLAGILDTACEVGGQPVDATPDAL